MLIGGRSARMGVDKAFLEIDGRPLALAVRGALQAAGAAPVVWVGGGQRHREMLPGAHVPDVAVAEGPVAGLLAALRWSPKRFVVVAACDLVELDPGLVRRLVRAARASNAGVAMPRLNGRPQAHLSVWSAASTSHVERLFAEGERSWQGVAPSTTTWLDLVSSPDGSAIGLVDLDTPEELAGWKRHDRLHDRRRDHSTVDDVPRDTVM